MEGLIDVLVELERVDEVLEGLIDELVLELGRAVLDDEELVETGFTEVGVLGLINPVDEVELFEVTLVTVELLELVEVLILVELVAVVLLLFIVEEFNTCPASLVYP